MESDHTPGGMADGEDALADRHADDIAALHAVSSLAPGEPDDRLALLLEAGCAVLGADRGLVLLRTGSELVARVVAGPKAPTPEVGAFVRDRRIEDVLARQMTVATLGGPAADDGGEPLGSGALVACPMWITGRVAGAIAFTVGEPREPFSSWQLALVDLVADGASRVLEHEADIRALVRLQSQAQAMISVIPDPVVRLNRDGRQVADDGGAVGGVFDPCAGGRPAGAEVDEATLDQVRVAVDRALATGDLQTDVYAAAPGSRARRFEARYVPSGPDEVLCIVRDVTEQHRAEVALAEQVAFEALAASLSTNLISCAPGELDRAIEVGLGEIATFFDADIAYIDELSADGTTLRVSHQWSRRDVRQRRRRGDMVDVAGFGWLTARFERAGHVFARGPGAMPPEATDQVVGGSDDRAGLWVRLASGGELVGVLGMAWRTHEPPENDEVLGLVRFAADAFVGAIERRNISLLADGQAGVFELIARGAPLATALQGARGLLLRHVLGAEVVIATVDENRRLALVASDPERDPGDADGSDAWFSAVEPDLANPFGQAVVTGEPVIVSDVVGDPRYGPGALPPGDHRSATIIPVRSPRNGLTLAVVAMLGSDTGAPQVRPAVIDSVRSLVTVAVERWIDERRLAHQATHDPLTGVGNRAALLDRLDLALARARRTGRAVAVLYCDLDRFKSVNDHYGHDRGDRLLVEVAARITRAVRPSDTVCRTGGDEFVIVCEDLLDGDQARLIADRVRTSVEEAPVDIGETTLAATVSVGLAVADQAVDDADRLLRTADLAMYANKQRRRALRASAESDADAAASGIEPGVGAALPAPGRPVADPALLELAGELSHALDDGTLSLAHQPLVGRDGSLAGVEVLVRWLHPRLGELTPERILAASATDPSLAARLGRWVRRTGFAQRAEWIARSGPEGEVPLHVNVSGAELLTESFVDVVVADTREAGVDLDALVVEVPERDLGVREARSAVARLARAGIVVLVEDAGLGGMPLPDLAELAVRGIKLSRSLVSRIVEDDPLGLEVVRSLVLLAHGLSWRSVGVGVETDHQRAVLFGFGVQAIQGRVVTMPVTAADLGTWLAQRSA